MSFITDGSGAFTCHLAKARPEAFTHVDQLAEQSPPKAPGSADDFLVRHGQHPVLLQQMRNKVKKCAQCGKPNAFTLVTCNQCGADLRAIETSFTTNIFMGFIYGVEKGPFPFTISLRAQTPEVLVFDDLLALSQCHLNVIPTTHYIPDFRYLLRQPAEGLALLRKMFEACWGVFEGQYLANAAFRAKAWPAGTTPERLRASVIAGANYPPSQYQLHLQWMVAPLLPFQHFQFIAGVHYTYKRFFPLEFLYAALELNEPLAVTEATPIEEVIEFFRARGVDYDAIHAAAMARYKKEHDELSAWAVADFEAVVVENSRIVDLKDGQAGDADAVSRARTADKTTLQNYGRPYEGGKPTGTYYKFAKDFPDGVAMW